MVCWVCCAATWLAGSVSLADETPSFAVDIQPILKSRCQKCHGAETQKAELSLANAAAIQKGGESGVILVAGRSQDSRLYELVKHREMPPKNEGTLSDAEIELIRRWIDGGASFGDPSSANAPMVTQHDVIPVLMLRCVVCHGRHVQEAGLDLRSRGSMLRGGKSGPALVPGRPDDSLMLKRIRAEEMPPHARLTEASVKPMEPEETAMLARWIEQGAPLAKEEAELAATNDDPLVRSVDREFWSFQPLHPVPVPRVEPTAPVRTPVDAFVREKLVSAGLDFSEPADRLTLLRRVTFDLTGLPPTPDEAKEFLDDLSPDAFERVVDRLLTSPRYGERWGRHWLDVAGYSETEGRREQHLPRPFAWRYRDYVIRSFNDDKSYDRFLLEQIAGDELADYEHAAEITQEIEDNLVATAFLRMAPDPTWANLTGFVPDRLEVIADSLDVLGSGVMGLTFKCARCHSHKFDPIPQRDYYRLAALMKGAYDEHDWLKPQVTNYGGAMSVGLGERLLPNVTTRERKQWEQLPDEKQRPPEPKIMALWDRGDPSPTYIYRRGNYVTAGSFVTPGVPSVLSDPNKRFEVTQPFEGAKSTGRRLALARWLTDPSHPLTSRVIVNRVWKHHFGQGIVRSLGNFGKTGDRPTHPELLDYIAGDFIRCGWSMKTLHRSLILSTTYQQQSAVSEQAQRLDPANGLLSRMPMSRLEAEELRDAILMISGELNESGGGPSEPIQARPDGLVLTGQRRSIYVQQLRKSPPSLLDSFDLPSMNPNCLQRTDSLVATQALHLWNDAAIRQSAARFAGRVIQKVKQEANSQAIPIDACVEQIYQIALGRPPRDDERTICRESVTQLKTGWLNQAPTGLAEEEALKKALSSFCHTILNSADFLFID